MKSMYLLLSFAVALLDDDPARKRAVSSGIEYYVGYLRSNGGKAPDCLAQ